jgi:hypothetical protein
LTIFSSVIVKGVAKFGRTARVRSRRAAAARQFGSAWL